MEPSAAAAAAAAARARARARARALHSTQAERHPGHVRAALGGRAALATPAATRRRVRAAGVAAAPAARGLSRGGAADTHSQRNAARAGRSDGACRVEQQGACGTDVVCGIAHVSARPGVAGNEQSRFPARAGRLGAGAQRGPDQQRKSNWQWQSNRQRESSASSQSNRDQGPVARGSWLRQRASATRRQNTGPAQQ
jgi:hypothetical protein